MNTRKLGVSEGGRWPLLKILFVCFSGGAQLLWSFLWVAVQRRQGKYYKNRGFAEFEPERRRQKKKGGIATFKNGARGCVREWGAYVAQHTRTVFERKRCA